MPRKKTVPADVSAPAETVVKPAAEKPESDKKESVLEKAAAKRPGRKPAAKKPAAKKAERVEEIYLESGDAQWNIADCKAQAVAAYVAEGHRESSIKKLAIYLKPEEGKAYFVINDGMNGSIDL